MKSCAWRDADFGKQESNIKQLGTLSNAVRQHYHNQRNSDKKDCGESSYTVKGSAGASKTFGIPVFFFHTNN